MEIVTCTTAADRERFIRFQADLYRDEPHYVLPIVSERKAFLDPSRNPFFAHAEAQLFLALRGGQVVGRIAAVHDRRYNDFHRSTVGFFGMFESVDDPAVASALLETARGWLRPRGLTELVGPVNLSFNHDCGVLVEGFDDPPALWMPYNFPYYARLLEAAGLTKAKDLWSYRLPVIVSPPEKLIRVAERLRKQDRIRVRPLRIRSLKRELQRIKTVYNAMMEPRWEINPMTEAEWDFITGRLWPLAFFRPELCFIAEVGDEPVAFSLTFPDFNQALKAAGGALVRRGVPAGLLRMLWAAQRMDRLRILMIAVKPGYRHRGIDAALGLHTMRSARRMGFKRWDLGWASEDNDAVIHSIESFGAQRYKVYRLYRQPL